MFPVDFENPHLLWALPAVLAVLAALTWRSAAVTGIGRRAVLWAVRVRVGQSLPLGGRRTLGPQSSDGCPAGPGGTGPGRVGQRGR